MKKYLLFVISILISLVATSCQDEDFGYTEQDVFKGAYSRNFIKAFGSIDSNQSWDLSAYGRKQAAKRSNVTRSGDSSLPFDAETEDGHSYYRIEEGTLNWIDSKLLENQDNSSLGTAFGMLLAGQEFIAIPISQNGNEKVDISYGKFGNKKGSGSSAYYEIQKTTTTTSYDWDLYMVTLEPNENPDSKILWSKNSSNNIQTPDSESITCRTCDGRGMVGGTGDVPCEGCASQGYLPGMDTTCPKCSGSTTERGLCPNPKCDSQGHVECETCHGARLSDSVLRDLTINSMYLDVSTGEILDPTDGLKDMTSHTLCTTNAPDVIFKDDPIRMMRIIRFASILGWDIDKTTWFGILRNHELIKTASTEKFVRELNQILLTDKPSVGLKRLISSGILYDMIPELYAINHIDGIDIKENVWNHTLKVVDNSEPILLNRIAALLHDIGKPISHKIINDKSRFYSHEFSGREAATSVLKRLRYSDRVIDSVRNAIRYHMTFTYTTTNNFLYIPNKKIGE